MASEFVINDIRYTHIPLDTFTQMFACRKTSILFTALSKGYPLLDVLYDMPQDDLSLVIGAIMPSVKRFENGVWANVFNKDAGRFAYNDISAFAAFRIIMEVLTEYVPPFLAENALWESAIQAGAKAKEPIEPV
jgi:hypothetical protein